MKILNKAELREYIFGLNGKEEFNWTTDVKDNFEEVKVNDFSGLFEGLSFKKISLEGCTNLKVISTSKMFKNCRELEYIHLGSVVNDYCKNVTYMFQGCKSLNDIEWNKFSVSSCDSLEGMYDGCESIDIIRFGGTYYAHIFSVKDTFRNCKKLDLLDLSFLYLGGDYGFDTMLEGCIALDTVYLPEEDAEATIITDFIRNKLGREIYYTQDGEEVEYETPKDAVDWARAEIRLRPDNRPTVWRYVERESDPFDSSELF